MSESQPKLVSTAVMQGAQLRTVSGIMTNLILLGSIRSISLSFFQKTCGFGEASTLHSRLTVSPSRALEFNSFWTKVGGWRASWAAHRTSSAVVSEQDRRRAHAYLMVLELSESIPTRPPVLPMTVSLMVKRLSPALFLATHSYTPASCTVVISMMNECIPFSHTNILWKSSGRTALPSRYQVTSGIGRPPTWIGEEEAFAVATAEHQRSDTRVVIYFEVDATEASLLHTEVCRDLQESRSVMFLLDGRFLVTPVISRCVVSPPAGRKWFLIHFQSTSVTYMCTNSYLSLMAPNESFYCGVNTKLVCVMCDVHLSTIQLQAKHQLNILKVKTKLFYLFTYQSPPVYLPSDETGCKTNHIMLIHTPTVPVIFLIAIVGAEPE